MTDETVGYGRPPRHSQFKPGQSGNRKGRPREAKNLSTLARKKFDEKVRVREAGRAKTLSKGEIGITKLVNRFAETGDPKLLKALVEHCPEIMGEKTEGVLRDLVEQKARPNTAAVLAWYRDRVLEQSAGTPALPTSGKGQRP